MGYKDAYRDWLSWCDDAEKKELLLLKDEKEIEDRFYRDLEFGTAGLRGIMGVGSNRMNRYNVRKATKGFADYLQDTYGKWCQDGVIIAYDSRNNSTDFAAEAAHVLCAAGIPVKFFTVMPMCFRVMWKIFLILPIFHVPVVKSCLPGWGRIW